MSWTYKFYSNTCYINSQFDKSGVMEGIDLTQVKIEDACTKETTNVVNPQKGEAEPKELPAMTMTLPDDVEVLKKLAANLISKSRSGGSAKEGYKINYWDPTFDTADKNNVAETLTSDRFAIESGSYNKFLKLLELKIKAQDKDYKSPDGTVTLPLKAVTYSVLEPKQSKGILDVIKARGSDFYYVPLLVNKQGNVERYIPRNNNAPDPVDNFDNFIIPPGYSLPTEDALIKFVNNQSTNIVLPNGAGNTGNYSYDPSRDLVFLDKDKMKVPVLVVQKSLSDCDLGKQGERNNVGVVGYSTFEFPVPFEEVPSLKDFFDLSPDDMCVLDRNEGKYKLKMRVNLDEFNNAKKILTEAIDLQKSGKKLDLDNKVVLSLHDRQLSAAMDVISGLGSDMLGKLKDSFNDLEGKVTDLSERMDKPESNILWWSLGGSAVALIVASIFSMTVRDFFLIKLEQIKKVIGIVPPYLEDWAAKVNEFKPYDSATGNREQVIRAIMDQLAVPRAERRTRSVILLGASSQGKTAMMKEIARRIAVGDPSVPPALRGKRFYGMNFDEFESNTKYRGEDAGKANGLKRWLKAHPEAILFGDEFHKAMGIGETNSEEKGGKKDLFNRLKEAIADGEQAWVLSTTTEEYHLHVVPMDPSSAFQRRFMLLTLDTYSPTDVKKILKDIVKGIMPSDGVVQVDDAAIDQLVDKQIEAGTPDFLLLNATKDLLIETSMNMQKKLMAGDADVKNLVNDRTRELLIKRLEIAGEIEIYTDKAAYGIFTRPLYYFQLRRLKKEFVRVQRELAEVAKSGDPGTHLVITPQLALDFEAGKRRLAGMAGIEKVIAGCREYADKIKSEVKKLEAYEIKWTVPDNLEGAIYTDEKPWQIAKRLSRLHAQIVELHSAIAGQKKTTFMGSSEPEKSLTQIIELQAKALEALNNKGFVEALDTEIVPVPPPPAPPPPEAVVDPEPVAAPATQTINWETLITEARTHNGGDESKTWGIVTSMLSMGGKPETRDALVKLETLVAASPQGMRLKDPAKIQARLLASLTLYNDALGDLTHDEIREMLTRTVRAAVVEADDAEFERKITEARGREADRMRTKLAEEEARRSVAP